MSRCSNKMPHNIRIHLTRYSGLCPLPPTGDAGMRHLPVAASSCRRLSSALGGREADPESDDSRFAISGTCRKRLRLRSRNDDWVNVVNVFLDTSATRSSLHSQKVRKSIQDLVKYGVLKLHTPEIVVRELVTGVSADAFPSVSIDKELKRMIPWMGDGEFATRTKAAVALLRDLRKQGQIEATIDVLLEENDDVGGLELYSASVDSVDEVTQHELAI